MKIRPGSAADHVRLLAIWLRSVRATHAFLSEDDILALLPVVREQALPALELWVVEADEAGAVGFIGLNADRVEALFIDPDHARRGHGRRLLEHARLLKGPLRLDVNEQNPAALRFYQSQGFVVTGRSPLDGGGRPFPLLHLEQGAA